jgi:hypothetical protein
VILVFAKGKHPFIYKHGNYTNCYINDDMLLVQVVEMEPAYQKQNGPENLVLMPQVTSEIISYQVTC